MCEGCAGKGDEIERSLVNIAECRVTRVEVQSDEFDKSLITRWQNFHFNYY